MRGEVPTVDTGARRRFTLARRVLGISIMLALGLITWLWWDSLVPATYSAAPAGMTGAGHHPAPAGRVGTVDVTELIADPLRVADVRIELEAATALLVNSRGRSVPGFTLNGSSPGPVIRAREGELVQVTLRNRDIVEGTTLHWHGVDVPGAMDGVAGVTQDAVEPGESFTYRFLAEDPGTYWYHSHQVSHHQVVAGLFGVLVIEPAQPPAGELEEIMLLHTYPGGSRTLGVQPGQTHRRVPAGATVRVRALNTDNPTTFVWVSGAPARVLAVDGRELNEPTPFGGRKVRLGAGSRVDLAVTVPATGGVRIQAPGVSLVLGSDGTGVADSPAPAEELDLLSYGTPLPWPFLPGSPERSAAYIIDRRIGFLAGRPGYWWTVNGRMGINAPMFHVREGEVFRMRITNNSAEVHPMHLHGHHLLVLSRDGEPATGSPWWSDSLDVGAGQSFDVAFLADNPGVWMDHCHNLPHAVEGLMTHLVYEGVSTGFLLGRGSGNVPE